MIPAAVVAPTVKQVVKLLLQRLRNVGERDHPCSHNLPHAKILDDVPPIRGLRAPNVEAEKRFNRFPVRPPSIPRRDVLSKDSLGRAPDANNGFLENP